MRVLYLAAEATPFAKVGGLADVAGELPRALARLGLDVRLCLPFHTTIDRSNFKLTQILSLRVEHGTQQNEVQVFETKVRDVPIWLIDGAPVQAAAGVYGEMVQDADKFTFFSLAIFDACESLEWIPDILHANDWHTGPSVMNLAALRGGSPTWRSVRSLYTVHNLPYMGEGAQDSIVRYGLKLTDSAQLPEDLKDTPLAQGLLVADWVNTVSPTYAHEIRTSAFGAGLEQVLEARASRLSGILNGIDPDVWDPNTDKALHQNYDLESIDRRSLNKLALQAELGLEQDLQTPLLGLVTRLDSQKGIDLLWPAIESLETTSWQLVLLGTGDQTMEAMGQRIAEAHPTKVRVLLRFDPELARRIYAGSDMLVIPSRYEPCGLAQMIAMRYGSVPVVRFTGGLADTVFDKESGKHRTGFVFENASEIELRDAIERAISTFQQPDTWREIQVQGMRMDTSWSSSAAAYRDLYATLMTDDVS